MGGVWRADEVSEHWTGDAARPFRQAEGDVEFQTDRTCINTARIDPAADYGALNGLARHRVQTELIARHWDDLLRVAGSLKMGTISASE